MYLLNLLMINFCCVVIIGYLNAPNEILSSLFNCFTNGRIKEVTLKKPFGCPLCMCWWISWIYLLIALPFTWYYFLIGVTLALLNALLTKYTLYIIETADMLICRVMAWIQSHLKF